MERLKLDKRLAFIGVKTSGGIGVTLSYTHSHAFGGSVELEAFKDKRMLKTENQNEFPVSYFCQGKTRCC